MRLVIAFGFLCFLFIASPAVCGDDIRLGSIVLSLGQTPDDVERRLERTLDWSLPATVFPVTRSRNRSRKA